MLILEKAMTLVNCGIGYIAISMILFIHTLQTPETHWNRRLMDCLLGGGGVKCSQPGSLREVKGRFTSQSDIVSVARV